MKDLSKIYIHLLTEEEKAKIAKEEKQFIEDAIKARNVLTQRLIELAQTTKSIKDIAKAIETLNTEIKHSLKSLTKLQAGQIEEQSEEEDLEDIKQIENRLREFEQLQ